MKTPTMEFSFSVNILFFTKIESHCSCLPVTFKTFFNKGATNKTKFWLIVTFLLKHNFSSEKKFITHEEPIFGATTTYDMVY